MTWDALKVAALVVAGNVGAAIWGARAELLVTFAILAAWILLTLAALSVVPAKFLVVVWYLSIALLLLSLVGWRLLWTIGTHGVYALTRDKETGARNA